MERFAPLKHFADIDLNASQSFPVVLLHRVLYNHFYRMGLKNLRFVSVSLAHGVERVVSNGAVCKIANLLWYPSR
jgi:hypothetical protein